MHPRTIRANNEMTTLINKITKKGFSIEIQPHNDVYNLSISRRFIKQTFRSGTALDCARMASFAIDTKSV